MTAPSAAHRPQLTRPSTERPPRPRRRARRLAGLAGGLLLAWTATGCVTVHGATALVPSSTTTAARAALARFASITDQANTKYDAQLNSEAETGAYGALDGAAIRAGHAANPAGNPNYRPLKLSDTRFLIPQQVGWPKWFVVDTAENRDHYRWLMVFIHGSASQPWRAAYTLVISPGQDPDFATDPRGYAEPVPADSTSLAVPPGELAGRYAAYLQHGTAGSSAFADGRYTSQTLASRARSTKNTPQLVTQFADEAGDPAHYPTVALRLRDGGALVFFTTQFQFKQTQATGPVEVPSDIKALMTGTPNKSITLYWVSQQVVTVPPTGKVTFLQQSQGVVDATGQ